MTDIVKLLTEAGFERQDFGFYALPCTGIGVDLANPGDDPSEVRITMPKTQLPAILLALQGRVALTEEECQAIEVAISEARCGEDEGVDAEARKAWKSHGDILRNLLTRSTADVVSLADVEEAFDIYDRDLRDSNSSQSEIQAVEQAQAAIMRWLRLNTKQHHQEGES